jgi:hypothetical protein
VGSFGRVVCEAIWHAYESYSKETMKRIVIPIKISEQERSFKASREAGLTDCVPPSVLVSSQRREVQALARS